MDKPFGISDLRSELGISLEEFGREVGISSKGHMSAVERGERPCSLAVALRIEDLSCGRINAAVLCDDVRAARAGFHASADTAAETTVPPCKLQDRTSPLTGEAA